MLLCCGEALIDMIPSQSGGYKPHSGGAILNTAISLGRLGVDVGILSGLSSDLFGQQLIRTLHASHVDTSHAIVSARPTTLAFVFLKDGHATYTFYDENSAGRMISRSDLPALPAKVKALYFGGISLACEPCADTYAELAETEGKNRLVMLDPNIRPQFVKNETRFRARLEKMFTCSDIIKVSDEDLDWIYPDKEDTVTKIERLAEFGAALVVLTRGSSGASAFPDHGKEISVPIQRVKAKDTVGAGDTFNAGFLAQLDEMGLLGKNALQTATAKQLKKALISGANVAAVTVSREGANPPWKSELK